MMVPARHIWAGFTLGFRHRQRLARILVEPPPRTRGVLDLDPRALKDDGITVLALDFDGVLAPHGSRAPHPEARVWLDRCAAVLGEDRLFILSNKPTAQRREWFGRHYPSLRFIGGVAKKPFPDGIIKIARLAGVPPSSILMVDDRLLTGCLAAILAGARPAYIRTPCVSFHQRPVAELFFMLLRSWERLALRCYLLFAPSQTT